MHPHNCIRKSLFLPAAFLTLVAAADAGEAAWSAGSEPPAEDISVGTTAQMDGIQDRPMPPGAETDWEIERNVKKALFRNPYVDSENIDVTVKEGVARLTGSVMTWSEREQAEKSARQGGARSVDNDLAVVRGPGSEQP